MNGAFDISLSGLIAQRQRIVTFTADSENADSEAAPVGVKYRVELDTQTPFRKVHEPDHQHADKEGYVLYPNIDMIHEQINMMEAARAYEANLVAIKMTVEMSNNAYRILA